MPRGIKGSGPKTPNVKRHHFLIAGTVVFNDGGGNDQKMKVNGVHIDIAKDLNAAALGRIQVLLQMHFHTKYQKTHTAPPEITDAIIGSITYLGCFTEKDFLKDAPGTQEEKPEEKKPVAPVSVKERLESEVKADMATKAELPVNAPAPEAVAAAVPAVKLAKPAGAPEGAIECPLPMTPVVAAVAPVIELPAVTPEPVKQPLIEVAPEAPKAS